MPKTVTKWLNEEPWEHRCKNGTVFRSSRCDFREGVVVTTRISTTEKQLLQDVGEMVAYHAMTIHSQLNGFQGYDCITYTLRRTFET